MQPRRIESAHSNDSVTSTHFAQEQPSTFDEIRPWEPRSLGQWWSDLSGSSKIVVVAIVIVLGLVIMTSGVDQAPETGPAVQEVEAEAKGAPKPDVREAVPAEDGHVPSVPPSLSEYVGKNPSDEVRGTSFWQQTAVFDLIGRVIADPTMAKTILDGGVEGQISQQGEWIRAYACMPHNCAGLNWSVVIKSDGTSGAVCYHNDDDDRDGWYNGETALPNEGNCMPH